MKHRKKTADIGRFIKTAVVVMLGVVLMLGFGGCFAKKYNVDYGGSKFAFRGAKDSYRAGSKVTVYYNMIATDTDYRFYLDGETINSVTYDDKKGFVISFIMPEHDVKLEVDIKESMTYVPG